jgi:hypothetical protein
MHTITATVEDSGENHRSTSVSIAVGLSSTPTTVQVSSVTYALQGTTLVTTVKLVDEFGSSVAGASVRAAIMEWVFTGDEWMLISVTNSQGNAQSQIPNADLGCYVTSVEDVVATGLTFIWGTPSNNFCIGF